VIIDPNVFVSALMAKPGSAAVAAAQAVATDKLTLVACPHLLAELTGVAHREKFRKYFSIEQAELLVAALELKAEMRPDPPTGLQVCLDPEDDYLFALAVAANVEVVVSGDRKVQVYSFLALKFWRPGGLWTAWMTSLQIHIRGGLPS